MSPKTTILLGDIVEMAKSGNFGVILNLVDCYNKHRGVTANALKIAFGTDQGGLCGPQHYGSHNKLGQIETKDIPEFKEMFYVVNLYAIYKPDSPGPYGFPIDYDALRLCLRKVNLEYSEAVVGIPKNGFMSGGGKWELIQSIIEEELTDVVSITYVVSIAYLPPEEKKPDDGVKYEEITT